MKQKPKELDWEITFGGMVLDYYMCCGSNGFAKANPKYEKLVDFIDKLLTKQRTELLEEIKSELPKPMDYVDNIDTTNNLEIALYNQRKDAWNECLSQVKNLLNKKNETKQ